jgi:uncharacterized membrane protein
MDGMKFNRRLLAAGAILGIFTLAAAGMVASYVLAVNGFGTSPFLGFLFQYHIEMMLGVSIAGVVVGAAVYFLLRENAQEKSVEAAGNAELLLSFLGSDERDVVRLLLDSEGHTTQAQISKSTGISRLRAHRVVGRLLARKLITAEKIGKTNMLWLANSVYEALRAK